MLEDGRAEGARRGKCLDGNGDKRGEIGPEDQEYKVVKGWCGERKDKESKHIEKEELKESMMIQRKR